MEGSTADNVPCRLGFKDKAQCQGYSFLQRYSNHWCPCLFQGTLSCHPSRPSTQQLNKFSIFKIKNYIAWLLTACERTQFLKGIWKISKYISFLSGLSHSYLWNYSWICNIEIEIGNSVLSVSQMSADKAVYTQCTPHWSLFHLTLYVNLNSDSPTIKAEYSK